MTPKQPAQILVVTERESGLQPLIDHIRGFAKVQIVSSGYDALHYLEIAAHQVCLIDYDISLMEPVETVKRLSKQHPQVRYLVIAREDSKVNDIATGLQNGARNYLTRNSSVEKTQQLIKPYLKIEKSENRPRVTQWNQELTERYKINSLIGDSPQVYRIFQKLENIIDSDVSVLIQGESGTGKELVARLVHLISRRASKSFIAVNCAAIPENLLESELFGYEKGAFTGAASQKTGKFELADGGTIFLDEIGDMSTSLQAKILRAIELGEIQRLGGTKTIEIDVRIISATNQNLVALMESGEFREDLYYRLNVYSLQIAPLRERVGDIPLLAYYFLDKFNRKNSKEIQHISEETIEMLQAYPWPGNIRELQNLVEQASLLSSRQTLSPGDFPTLTLPGNDSDQSGVSKTGILKEFENAEAIPSLEEIEKVAIQQTLKLVEGNITLAAETLGISRVTLYRKIEKYQINPGIPG